MAIIVQAATPQAARTKRLSDGEILDDTIPSHADPGVALLDASRLASATRITTKDDLIANSDSLLQQR